MNAPIKDSPLDVAFKAWVTSPEGKIARSRHTRKHANGDLTALRAAYVAGALAMRAIFESAVTEHEKQEQGRESGIVIAGTDGSIRHEP